MIIAVASGKGGTGKTTVALALAQSLESVNLIDADVEEPNLHLFFSSTPQEHQDVYRMVPKIEEDRCLFCKKCQEICHFNALSVLPGVIMLFEELCHGCYGCIEVCPQKCMKPQKRLVGKIYSIQEDKIFLAYGKLKIGEPMSSPLIKALKKNFIHSEKINIIDCPPGTGCPVLNAVKGADFCILVTEPTPFGLHDLQQATEAVKALGVPAGVIINRAGTPYPELYNYLKKENIPLLLEIPNEAQVAQAYAQGKGLLEVKPELKEKFIKIVREISL